MSHSETCPVCHGKGNVSNAELSTFPTSSSGLAISTCHGCGGKGWVTVEDHTEPVDVRFITN